MANCPVTGRWEELGHFGLSPGYNHKSQSHQDFAIILELMEDYDFRFCFYDLLYKASVFWFLLMPIFFSDMLGQSEGNQK